MGRHMYRHLLENSLRDVGQTDGCLLVPLLGHLRIAELSASNSRNTQERKQLCGAIERSLAEGFTLRSQMPHVPTGLQEEWLGRRLVFAHSRWFSDAADWTSIVSSRLGRYGRLLADWPALLELLLRSIRRAGSLYLAVPDTTVAPLVEPLLARSAVPYVRMRLPATDNWDVAAWLAAVLMAMDERPSCDRELCLSPELAGATSRWECWPLQDRVAVCCAQRVRALLVRRQGTTAQLLERRLTDPRFTAGTVSVFLPSVMESHATDNASTTACRVAQLDWLERGAVGWYVPPREPNRIELGCRQRAHRAEAPLWQLTTKYALCSSERAPREDDLSENESRYLVHCVRGTRGVMPSNTAADFIAHLWLAGRIPDESPLATLVRILESGVLRGRAALNRSKQSCVSFSAVPLDELVARRSFKPHLGRWDWEPFGLLIQRQALEQLGARPVIYGDAEVYRQLTADQRPFFQPAKRRSRRLASEHGDWEQECEWRFVGDVRLNELPRSAVHVFVAYAHQARALARHSPWPVIWLQDAQTLAPPVGSKRPRRREVRTGRN